MSLCFLKALAQVNRIERGISYQEYIQHLLIHLKGTRHPEDDIPGIGNMLASVEPWAGSLREIALRSSYEPLEDTSSYESFLIACLNGDVESGANALKFISSQGWPDPVQPGACLAAQNKHDQMLRFCLDNGATFDRYLTQAGTLGAKDEKVLQILWDSDWARVKSDPEARRAQILVLGEDSFASRWLTDHATQSSADVDIQSSRKKDCSVTRGRDTRSTDDDGDNGGKSVPVEESTDRRLAEQRPSPDSIQRWFGDVPW